MIEKQNEDLKDIKLQLDERNEVLQDANIKLEDLSLRVEDRSSLKVLFDDISMLQVEHRKLYGDVPLDREDATLTCLMGTENFLSVPAKTSLPILCKESVVKEARTVRMVQGAGSWLFCRQACLADGGERFF